jgi:hypothetical protein
MDEEYFSVVLANVGDRPHLMEKLEPGGKVDRALEAAPGLDQIITNALNLDKDGRIWLQPDFERISRITTKLAYGLYCLTYGRGASHSDFSTLHHFGPGAELPQQLIAAQYIWPGIRRKRWITVQSGVFNYLFSKGWFGGDPPLYCFMDFHHTSLAVVACPPPIGRKVEKRLRSKPWK